LTLWVVTQKPSKKCKGKWTAITEGRAQKKRNGEKRRTFPRRKFLNARDFGDDQLKTTGEKDPRKDEVAYRNAYQ